MIYKDFMTEDLKRIARKEEREKKKIDERKSWDKKLKREKKNNDAYGSTSDNVRMNKNESVLIRDKREREWKRKRKNDKMRENERIMRKKKQRRYNLYF